MISLREASQKSESLILLTKPEACLPPIFLFFLSFFAIEEYSGACLPSSYNSILVITGVNHHSWPFTFLSISFLI